MVHLKPEFCHHTMIHMLVPKIPCLLNNDKSGSGQPNCGVTIDLLKYVSSKLKGSPV